MGLRCEQRAFATDYTDFTDCRRIGLTILVRSRSVLTRSLFLSNEARRSHPYEARYVTKTSFVDAPLPCASTQWKRPRCVVGQPGRAASAWAGGRDRGVAEAEWADRLLADTDAARHDGAAAGRYRIVPLPPDRFVRWWAMAGGELVFLFDATEQQRADQAARRLLNDLSHELRTPLATILTHAEVQSLPNLPDATRAELLRLLKEETQRAVRLVNAMLELGRLETSGELAQRPVDLLAVAEAAVQQIMPQAESHAIHLSMEADTPLPAVAGEADSLLRVFLNLLDNAVKFSRSGDRVIISLRRDPHGVRCSVCDTGPGIPAQHVPYVTRRFYRAAPPDRRAAAWGWRWSRRSCAGTAARCRSKAARRDEATGTCMSFVLPAAPAEDGQR